MSGNKSFWYMHAWLPMSDYRCSVELERFHYSGEELLRYDITLTLQTASFIISAKCYWGGCYCQTH